MSTPATMDNFLSAIRMELDGEEGARDSYLRNTLEHEYHDGRCDGLRWALEYFTGPKIDS